MKLRRMNKIYAQTNGYFWLPCPICDQMFGGHEWDATLRISQSQGVGVCPDCVEEATKRNTEKFGYSEYGIAIALPQSKKATPAS